MGHTVRLKSQKGGSLKAPALTKRQAAGQYTMALALRDRHLQNGHPGTSRPGGRGGKIKCPAQGLARHRHPPMEATTLTAQSQHSSQGSRHVQ